MPARYHGRKRGAAAQAQACGPPVAERRLPEGQGRDRGGVGAQDARAQATPGLTSGRARIRASLLRRESRPPGRSAPPRAPRGWSLERLQRRPHARPRRPIRVGVAGLVAEHQPPVCGPAVQQAVQLLGREDLGHVQPAGLFGRLDGDGGQAGDIGVVGVGAPGDRPGACGARPARRPSRRWSPAGPRLTRATTRSRSGPRVCARVWSSTVSSGSRAWRPRATRARHSPSRPLNSSDLVAGAAGASPGSDSAPARARRRRGAPVARDRRRRTVGSWRLLELRGRRRKLARPRDRI